MVIPLLTTKLNPPPLGPDLIQRPQLIERLNKGINGKLTMLSAPAGFGKTTAVIQWLLQIDRAYAWVSLDNGDNDSNRFLTYFISALQNINQNFGKGIQTALQMPQAPPAAAVIAELINDIAAYNNPFILVLDDYHQIDNQQIHDLIAYFIEHQPENILLVISTRYDLPISVSKLRSQRQLTELRSADLRFTLEETSDFLNGTMALELPPESIKALENRTEGWAATLQLLALSLQAREDKLSFVNTFSGDHTYIVDYLVDEIMTSQSEQIQSFLVQTSVLDMFCVSLADAVLEISDSQDLIEQIAQVNLLLIPLDDERRWYRYHHLFVDYLRQGLTDLQPQRIPQLHLRAAAWYQENGYVEEAIKHGMQAEAYDFVIDLIEDNAEIFWWRGEHSLLHKWLLEIPHDLTAARPGLNIIFSIIYLMGGKNDEAEKYLEIAEKALAGNQTKPEQAEMYGMISAVRASCAFLLNGDVPTTIEYARQALQLLPEDNATWRCVVALASGDAHALTGDLIAAKEDYQEAVNAAKQADHLFLFMVASAKLANSFLVRGLLHDGADTARQAMTLADEREMLHTPRTALLFIILADIYCEWNQLSDASKYIHEGLELSRRANNVFASAWGYRTLGKILFSKGDLSGAQNAIDNLEDLTRKSNLPHFLISSLVTWKVRIEIARSKKDKDRLRIVERLLGDNDSISNEEKITYDSYLRLFSLARLMIAQQKYPVVEDYLERLLQISGSWGYTNGMIEVLVLQSVTYYAQDKVDQALSALKDALSRAEPEGYIRLFVDEGRVIADLLKQIGTTGIFSDYITTLLAAFEEFPGVETPKSDQPLIEPLSERELEILDLLTTELSVPEIADRLMVSANTVRTHTRNIYAKLEVHNRRAAVRRAEELGFL